MEIGYTNYTNLDASFGRPHQCGDRLVAATAARSSPTVANRSKRSPSGVHPPQPDDRPDGQLCPPMSVGDVAVIGEIAVSVDACGSCRVHPDQADVICDRSWRRSRRAATGGAHGVARDIVTKWATPAPSSPPPGCGVDGIGP